MCKKTYRREQADFAPTAYEGQTIRFGGSSSAGTAARSIKSAHGFPWWLLWLIWPLIGLLKWAAPLYLGALAALRESIGLPSQSAAMLLAAALIIAGAALIWRR